MYQGFMALLMSVTLCPAEWGVAMSRVFVGSREATE